MIFVDSNVPMYLVGAPHPHKTDAQRLLESFILDDERLVTDAEVFREIVHRYVVIEHRDAIQPAFDALLGIVDDVFAIDLEDVERAKTIVVSRTGVSARDAIHVSAMERHGISRILSFDRRFDTIPGIERSPMS